MCPNRGFVVMEKSKRLYRSNTNKIFAGVCGGLGDYFEVDPVLIRLAWLLVVIFTGVVPGLVTYVAAIYVVPKPTLISLPVGESAKV